MRVCLVAPELLPVPPVRGGAIETGIAGVAPELAGLGADVHVISMSDPLLQPTSIPLGSGRLTYHSVDIPQPLRRFPIDVIARGAYYFRRAGAIINRLKPEIVRHHNRPLGLLMAKSRYAHPCRHVVSIHNLDYGWCLSSRRVDRLFFRRAFAQCDKVLTVSDFLNRYVRRRMPTIDPGRVITIHNGVDTTLFTPNGSTTCRAEFNLSDAPLILFAGRIDPRKGVHLLLEAFRLVKRQVPSAHLAIVGPRGSYWHKTATAYAQQIEEAASRLPDVHLLDPIYDRARLARLYATADAACLPFCSEEGFGFTSVEMQACGVPVVTTSIGGVPETVAEGRTGFLVPPADIGALAERLVQLLDDEPLRSRMRQAARQFAVERFSWPVVAQRLFRHYSALL